MDHCTRHVCIYWYLRKCCHPFTTLIFSRCQKLSTKHPWHQGVTRFAIGEAEDANLKERQSPPPKKSSNRKQHPHPSGTLPICPWPRTRLHPAQAPLSAGWFSGGAGGAAMGAILGTCGSHNGLWVLGGETDWCIVCGGGGLSLESMWTRALGAREIDSFCRSQLSFKALLYRQ